jgi:hypothetical protein
MQIIYECMNFRAPVPKPPKPVSVPKVPEPPPVPAVPKPPRPYQRLNDIEKYLKSNNPVSGPDLFVPLVVIEHAYEEFCKHHRMMTVNFKEQCPLPIVRMEGAVTWKAIHHGPVMTFENPEVVLGVNLRGFFMNKNSPLKAFVTPKNPLPH